VDKNVDRDEAEADGIGHAVPFAHPLENPRGRKLRPKKLYCRIDLRWSWAEGPGDSPSAY
jgi:hypothetical protein